MSSFPHAPLIGLAAVLIPMTALAHSEAGPDVELRIRYYEAKVKESPSLFPAHVELGLAYLDMARHTGDPELVQAARKSIGESLRIQETYEGFRAMLMVENHSHHFREALKWGERAADASLHGSRDPDPEILAMIIEAELGLGMVQAVKARLERFRHRDDFHAHASRAKLAMAERRWADAVAWFERAGRAAGEFPARTDADRKQLDGLRAWAEVSSARALSFAGKVGDAREHLRRASAIRSDGVLFISVSGQVELAANDPAKARAILEKALEEHHSSAELHHGAMLACLKLGDRAGADQHFRAAQRELNWPIAAGEIYTLGALAQLHLDAGVRLKEALQMAEKNYQYKRDPEATATLTALRSKASR